MISESLVAAGLRPLLNDLYKYLKDKSSQIRASALINVNDAYAKAINVENVKTIWQVDKKVNLNEFYYPSRLTIENKTVEVSGLDSIPENGKVVIEGTAGQGKSILLRFLTGDALKRGSKIPLFIELRKINDKKSIEDLIISSLCDLGLNIDSNNLEFVFSSNKVCLLLDAFDEIPNSCIIDTICYIEALCARFNDLQIVVTSRPSAEIQKVAAFNVYQLTPLKPSDFKPILSKFFNDDENSVNSILKSLHSNSSGIVNLITTPLLLTLLTITYKSGNSIPEQPHEFYDKLFHLLINRHDSTKPGFKREFKTNLNEKQLEDMFCAFSFYCMLDKLTSIKQSDAVKLVNKSSTMMNLNNVCEHDFLSDCVKNTCLIVQEGFEYHFIHKSIREYHAASFIKNSPLDLKEKFYGIAVKTPYHYAQELFYLSVIDDFYYNELYFIPSFDNLLKKARWDGEKSNIDIEEFSSIECKFTNKMISSFRSSRESLFNIQNFNISSEIAKEIIVFANSLDVSNIEDNSVLSLTSLKGSDELIKKIETKSNRWIVNNFPRYLRAKQFVQEKKNIISSLSF